MNAVDEGASGVAPDDESNDEWDDHGQPDGGRPKAVEITAAYNGASVSDTLTVPTPPARHCPPRQCPRGFFWNTDDCACEAQ